MKREFISLSEESHRAAKPSHVLVFVHGIFSSHATFHALGDELEALNLPAKYAFRYFDYNFNRRIARNGDLLALDLKACFPPETTEVTIIAHSMGGLVSRAALLQHPEWCLAVKRLVMLGTPNHGCLNTGKLGFGAHLVREAIGVIWATTAHGRMGIKELTETSKIFAPLLTAARITATHRIDYVTVPGLFYNENAGIMREGRSKAMRATSIAAKLTEALPFWTTPLQLPHDGIVEERSVYLGAGDVVTRQSERKRTCEGKSNGGPYVHIAHRDHHDADHMAIHGTARSAAIIAGVLAAPSLAVWRQQVDADDDYTLRP